MGAYPANPENPVILSKIDVTFRQVTGFTG
jgi:hypothetical protein